MRRESIQRATGVASNAVWGPWMLALLLGTGVFRTIRLGFVQVVRVREALRAMMSVRSTGKDSRSPILAFMTALGATIGTGK